MSTTNCPCRGYILILFLGAVIDPFFCLFFLKSSVWWLYIECARRRLLDAVPTNTAPQHKRQSHFAGCSAVTSVGTSHGVIRFPLGGRGSWRSGSSLPVALCMVSVLHACAQLERGEELFVLYPIPLTARQ